ncbi:MAG: hypothetical protein AAGU21_13990 [Solidesulfovibrio sp.]|uniref:hypothetical protein n=1 Tax=Solidesulfovibrio sp. TaxID=2910990 RepID=UPI0031581403
MPEPREKAKEYSFWRWEYLRRNRKYLAHFKALNIVLNRYGILGIKYPTAQNVVEFKLQDMFVTSLPIDFMLPDNFVDLQYLSNRMNRIIERFRILPAAPWEGPTSDQLVRDAINSAINYGACPARYCPGYKLDEKTSKPVATVSKEQRIAEYDAIIAKDDYFRAMSEDNLEEWRTALLDFEFENIPSKKFRSNELARAVGVWLWDHVNRSPQQGVSKDSIWSATRALYRQHPSLSTSGLGAIEAGNNDNPENTFRKISGYHLATVDCISRHEVLPIKK